MRTLKSTSNKLFKITSKNFFKGGLSVKIAKLFNIFYKNKYFLILEERACHCCNYWSYWEYRLLIGFQSCKW